MGIKQLFQILKEEAPDAIKEGEIKNQFGRKVAIVRAISLPRHDDAFHTKLELIRCFLLPEF